MSNTRTIAKNSGWYGLENIISAVVALFTSIAINRYLGPTKNGYIVYVSYIASLVSSLGGVGIPSTTRKYMAEFIGMGDRGTARYIYMRTLQLQTGLATLATGGLLLWVLSDARGEYKLASVLLVLSIWPSMVNSIAAQANVATEDMSTNLPASVISALAYFIAIGGTVLLHWGVAGVGGSLLFMRTVDFLVRFLPTMKRVFAWETTHSLPPGLRKRMLSFAWQSVASMAVALIVWGRSEVILLKNLSPDIRQVSFYSLAFTMAEQLLLVATIFGTAAGTTVFAQFGRDKSKLPALTTSTFRYLALMSIPLHFIAASLAVPALLLLYGRQFQDAAMVVTLAPLLCIFKAFMLPAQSLLQSSERQSYLIGATVVAGIVDIGVAWYLIPVHGAVGACIGNGAAQGVAVGLMWAAAAYVYGVKLPWRLVGKIVFISALASITAHEIVLRLAPLWGILWGGSASLVILLGLIYWMRVLEPEDHDRFNILAGMLPKSIVKPANYALLLLQRPHSGSGGKAPRYPRPEDKRRMAPMIRKAYRRTLSQSIRDRLLTLRNNIRATALRMKLTPIRVDKCLLGGDNGISAARFARMVGDIRRASRPISEWPHVKFLRLYESIGDRIWDREVFEATDYFRNAALNIEICGIYHGATAPDEILIGARRFVESYRALETKSPAPSHWNAKRYPQDFIAVHPVKDSTCFQVYEGHHRLAIAYARGFQEVPGIIRKRAVTTPVQDLLRDVLWLKGRRELYQPIDSPEVKEWALVRRCSDRLAMMMEFLSAEGLMPPASSSYLDVACSYGWFVSEMQRAGFQAEGVERDPNAIAVGRQMYGLNAGQVRRADAVGFLQALQGSYDVTSCFSLAHHFVLNQTRITAEELMHLLDSATRRVLFFDMGQNHEYPGEKLGAWDPDYIHNWLKANTTFSRVVRLGEDEDSVPPFQGNFGRTLFACVR